MRAAENGEVIYVGNAVEGYGNLVLVKHANGFVSAYAHLSTIGVVKGDTISRGDAIGTVGMTGSVSRPQLHFELRKGATPVDHRCRCSRAKAFRLSRFRTAKVVSTFAGNAHARILVGMLLVGTVQEGRPFAS